MEAEYTLTLDDYIAFQRYMMRTSPALRRSIRIGYVAVVVIVLVFFYATEGWSSWPNALFSLAFLVACLALYAWLVRSSAERTGRRLMKEGKNKGTFGQHTLKLSQDGVVETTEVGETRASWAGIERVAENETYIFIYLSSTSAHVIPKRSFASATQAEQFYQLAQDYYRHAQI